MEPLESRLKFTHALLWEKTADFGSGTLTYFCYSGFLLSVAKSYDYDKVSEVSMVFYLCVVSVHSGRLRT